MPDEDFILWWAAQYLTLAFASSASVKYVPPSKRRLAAYRAAQRKAQCMKVDPVMWKNNKVIWSRNDK